MAKDSRGLFPPHASVHLLFLREQPSSEIELSSKEGVFGFTGPWAVEGGGWHLGERKLSRSSLCSLLTALSRSSPVAVPHKLELGMDPPCWQCLCDG